MIEPTPELPPRARRILRKSACSWWKSGTTSACAENTRHRRGHHRGFWNYLRVRGEYPCIIHRIIELLELPPRARRILAKVMNWLDEKGTTSACAENTGSISHTALRSRNYLRVRGEYTAEQLETLYSEELPPRARRIRCKMTPIQIHIGTTSACAENTKPILFAILFHRNYLRVRGEYTTTPSRCDLSPELPPRARRIPHHPPLAEGV